MLSTNQVHKKCTYTITKDKQAGKVSQLTKALVKAAKQVTKSLKQLNFDSNETAVDTIETVGNATEAPDDEINKTNTDENVVVTTPLPFFDSIKKKTIPIPDYRSNEDSGTSDVTVVQAPTLAVKMKKKTEVVVHVNKTPKCMVLTII